MLPALQNKYILVDTCVLSSLARHGKHLAGLFDSFAEMNCHLCINEFIYLEFVRIAKSNAARAEIDKLLSQFTNLPANDPDLYIRARDIYPLYNYCSSINNPKQVSVVDLLNVCYLSKHETSLYYITFDNNDFPLELLERVETGTVDVTTDILTWGIYKFESSRYKRVKGIYDKQV